MEFKTAEVIEPDRMVVTRAWRRWGDVGPRGQSFSYETAEFWGSKVEHVKHVFTPEIC